MKKRVLVTGGCGFIPSNVIRHLLANTPYEVVSLDALTYAGNTENLADVMGHERLSFVAGDIRDPESRVAQLVGNERTYRVLDELINTQPAVNYLKKVTFHAVEAGHA